MPNGGWGTMELSTEGEPLTVQVLGEESDTPIGEPRDLVSCGSGIAGRRLSRACRRQGAAGADVSVRGQSGGNAAHSISLDEGRLLGGEPGPKGEIPKRGRVKPIPFVPMTAGLELTPGKTDLIEWSEKSFIRRDGASGKVLWDAFAPKERFARRRDPAMLIYDLDPIQRERASWSKRSTLTATALATCSCSCERRKRSSPFPARWLDDLDARRRDRVSQRRPGGKCPRDAEK